MASREAAVTSQVQMGPEGLEPSPRWLRARDAADNTWIPIGPAGVEPTPYRLKGGYAAITPRPRMIRGRDGFNGRARSIFVLQYVDRGRISLTTGNSLIHSPLITLHCAVGREALESSSAVLQTAATPSQLPAQTKRPGISRRPALEKAHTQRGWTSQAQWKLA